MSVKRVVSKVMLFDSFSLGVETRFNRGFAVDLNVINTNMENIAFSSKGMDVDAIVFPVS